jgi:hypothetical protein
MSIAGKMVISHSCWLSRHIRYLVLVLWNRWWLVYWHPSMVTNWWPASLGSVRQHHNQTTGCQGSSTITRGQTPLLQEQIPPQISMAICHRCIQMPDGYGQATSRVTRSMTQSTVADIWVSVKFGEQVHMLNVTRSADTCVRGNKLRDAWACSLNVNESSVQAVNQHKFQPHGQWNMGKTHSGQQNESLIVLLDW